VAVVLFVFFFQAEDGIRDFHVTGVQTCALPISEGDRQLFRYRKKLLADLTRVKNRIKDKFLFTGISIPEEFDNANWSKAFLNWRSEERRVGKECRALSWRCT